MSGNVIGKRANWYRELADPKVVATVLRPSRHPQAWGLGAAGAAGAAAHTEPVSRRVGRHETVADAAVGALAGQSAYQLAGYAPSAYARHKVGWNTRLSQISDPAERTRHKAEDKARKAGIRAHTDAATGKVDWTGHYRDFPASHRYSRVFRTIGHTHRGRLGTALGATATATGAVVGARHGHQEMVKSANEIGVRETRVRPLRAAEFGAGAAGVLWGVPRLRMMGPALAHGARLAETTGGAPATRRALRVAERARAGLTRATKPLEAIRRFDRVNHAIEAVPQALRPAVAVTAGVLMDVHATPVRQREFVALRSA